MDNPFERLVPEDFRKVAQNDSVMGNPIAIVYYSKRLDQYYIQAQKVEADGSFSSMTFGPLPSHVFKSLSHIMVDVHGMDGKYYYLD